MARKPQKASSSITSESITSFARAATKEEELRRQNYNLLRQLDQAKSKSDELKEVFYRAAREAAAALDISAIPFKAPNPKGDGPEERAIIVASDLQLGKRTKTYNSEVCEERMERYARKIALITAVQRRDHPVRHARMYWLGDMIESENIFATQAHQIDSSLFRQVMVDGPRILTHFIRALLPVFETIHIAAVPGNHGRIGSRNQGYNPETNSDRMLYFFVRELFKDEPRVTWDIAYERNETGWYTVDYPWGKIGRGNLLFHGHQIKGWSGFPFYGTDKKVTRWAAGALPESAQAGGRGFHYAMFGHYHTATRLTLSHMRAWCNGSTESTNSFAQEVVAAAGEPEQLLLFMRPNRYTAEYWVDLLND